MKVVVCVLLERQSSLHRSQPLPLLRSVGAAHGEHFPGVAVLLADEVDPIGATRVPDLLHEERAPLPLAAPSFGLEVFEGESAGVEREVALLP